MLLGVPALQLAALRLGAARRPVPLELPYDSAGAGFMAMLAALVLDPGPVEEIGWRGMALPLLQRRFNALSASLLLGFTWGVWHLPAFFIAGLPQADFSLPVFLISTLCWSVLLTAVYNGTGGSVPLVFLFHWQINNPVFPDVDGELLAVLVLATVVAVLAPGPQRLARDKQTEVIPGSGATPSGSARS